jgi:hypothetical protein
MAKTLTVFLIVCLLQCVQLGDESRNQSGVNFRNRCGPEPGHQPTKSYAVGLECALRNVDPGLEPALGRFSEGRRGRNGRES